MSVRRALVDCAVLSLQGARVFYPCCKNCFSRIDVEQQDTARYRCFKCGHSCMREHVEYRYRLSLRVARDTSIFGVTVFGSCLNPFFGIHASGLQRLVENSDGPVGASTRSALLLKSVKDCFIGRHFIFGLKVTETESVPWFGSSSKDTDNFIATQMILPKATGLAGCTVASYYGILLQKAAEYEQGLTDPSKTSRPPATTLLLIRHRSPSSSFNNSTFCSSGLLSQALLRSQYHDCTLTPTPPWQQSLGLVTSSAEQEESCGTQDSGDETSTTLHHAERGYLENRKAGEETVRSPLLSLECSSYGLPLFPKHPHSSIENANGNTAIINTWFSPSPPGQNISKRFSTSQLTETFLKSSVAWEDLPFSESLTDFLSEENKDFDVVHETEPHQHVEKQNLMTRNNPEFRSQAENLSIQSISVCQNNTQITDGHSRILLDITNASPLNGVDRHELSDQVCKYPAGCVNKSRARNICSQDNKEAGLLSFENKEEEQLEGDTYNCSADLFSGSLVVDFITDKPSTCAESVTPIMSPEAFPVLSKPDRLHQRIEKVNVPRSRLDKPKLISEKSVNRDSLILSGTQELDFIPPSQSTPIVKAAVVSKIKDQQRSYRTLTLGFQPDNQDSFAFEKKLPQLDSQRPVKITSSVSKVNSENLVFSSVSSRHNHTFTPTRFWKLDKHKNSLLDQQHLEVQRGAPNTVSTGRIKCNSSDHDVTVCDSEEIIVSQTPAVKTQACEKLRRRRRRLITDDNRSGDLGYTVVHQQEDGVNCKITLLDQTLTSSQKGLAQTGNCDSETVEDLGGSNHHLLVDENEVCDWSKDLFSDSI
uniref:uncharacterized protein ddias n=1 Tax=Scatophagus argus TaxID=75038 RepID=UPI001ED8604A|nr:uncharacterized protein ddias [Scatophagus argus]